ncbi:L-seryl-tRNA(Sec) selenium transferase [candidate division KSB1 bacterium]|nr:L-seryl-tRNA(Sec) selenium transferase [candidate division KSB1 bacterium]
MSRPAKNNFPNIPSMDSLLAEPELVPILEMFQRPFVKEFLSDTVKEVKSELVQEMLEPLPREKLKKIIIARFMRRIESWQRPHLRRVINATGIVLHTGLGRAPYSQAAQKQVAQVMQGYCNLEIDLQSGKRGERNAHIADLLCQLTGAEAAVVVNNNAAAVFLALNTLAEGREAIISRGQLIEIGGSFRMPQVMEKSGVIMREVGTTNKTKLGDYSQAINEKTGAIVVAHTSNYRVMGFTADVALEHLCALAAERGIPVIHDLGGGVIFDLQKIGLPYEPLVQDSLKAGAAVVTFSGDKILGGPQSGLLVGKKEVIGQIAANPLMRVLRCDKLTYAALEATLRLPFSSNETRLRSIARLAEPTETIAARARTVQDALNESCGDWLKIDCIETTSQTGSGALPLHELASVGLALQPRQGSAAELARCLRRGSLPIIGYVKSERLILDFRTIDTEEINDLLQAIEAAKADADTQKND